MNTAIQVYPAFNALYYGYYLKGLYDLFGADAISYTTDEFPPLSQNCLAFIYQPSNYKVFIDAQDTDEFNQEGLMWSDVYAKVNVNPENVPWGFSHKIAPIGPNFGIRLWGPLSTPLHASKTYRLCPPGRINQREHFANYWRQYRHRTRISTYLSGHAPAERSYVFFEASLWANEAECNQYRANFIEACRSCEWLTFEGGFIPRTRGDLAGFEQYTVQRRSSFKSYLRAIKRSAVVFNTPAVLRCHGWKLGEFLALGKAIISTPLVRALPHPLEHGEQIHIVDGSTESVQEALHVICADEGYRQHLQHRAREYFLRYLQPRRVVERLFTDCGRSLNHVA